VFYGVKGIEKYTSRHAKSKSKRKLQLVSTGVWDREEESTDWIRTVHGKVVLLPN